jgi:hypothetical protein
MKNLTKEQINEGITLIAEFMGYEFISSSVSEEYYGWWKKGKFRDDIYPNPDFKCIDSWGFKYHSSFDSIIPVITKIQYIVDRMSRKDKVSDNYVRLLQDCGYIRKQMLKFNIEKTFQAVVIFITAYNKILKNSKK